MEGGAAANDAAWVDSPTVLALLENIIDGRAFEPPILAELLPEGGLRDEHVHHSRRVDGKLQVMALDLNTIDSKTADAQAAAFKQSVEEAIQLMEEAGMVDARAAELLRRFMPTCAMNDRASPARAAARKVLGLSDGSFTLRAQAAAEDGRG
jgi:hypothetical protein